jgi:hypothetical protein
MPLPWLLHLFPPQVTWKDAGAKPDSQGRTMHKKAQVGSWALQLGSVVLLEAEAEDEEGQEPAFLLGLVQCMWEDEDGEALAQVGCNILLCCGLWRFISVSAVSHVW